MGQQNGPIKQAAKESNDLSVGDIALHLRRLSIPISIGYFFHTMYNVVDTYFAGYISTDAIAALSLSFPVFFGVIACSIGLSSGTTALISHAIGGKDDALAKQFTVQSISFACLLSAATAVIGYIATPPIFEFLGASGDYLQLSLDYVNILFFGSIFFLLAGVLNASLTARGLTKPYRNFLIGSFFLNVILDPWFMFGGYGIPALGMSGISLATVTTQAFGCLYMGREVLRRGYLDDVKLVDFLPQQFEFASLARQGFPASANMGTVAIGIFITTYFVSTFGEAAVAGFGIAMRIEQIALLPAIGLNSAALAIVAQNYGAKKYLRAEQAWRVGNWYCVKICIPGFFLLQIFASELMSVFTDAEEVLRIGEQFLFVASLSLWAYAILWMSIYALQGLQRPVFGFLIGSTRQIIAPLLVLPVFIHVLQWEILGVWWGICAITWTACLITLWYTQRAFSALSKNAQDA